MWPSFLSILVETRGMEKTQDQAAEVPDIRGAKAKMWQGEFNGEAENKLV